jgi:SnoaL-like protein
VASSVDELIEAFIGLYARATLPHWRGLFLPSFTAAATSEDGSVTTWTLDQFYERQRQLFASGKPVSEALHETETHRHGDLACVRSDYVWTDGETTRPGRLMMLVVADRGEWKIQSLTFSYRG